jgi:ABC-2 type transport system permease protein
VITAAYTIMAETRKGLRLSWYYRFNLLMQLVTLSFIFLCLVFFIGNGSLRTEELSSAVLGYVVWFYAVNVINVVGIELVAEAQSGTLEQMCMSVSPSGVLLAGRAVSALITSTVMTLVLDIVLMIALRTPIPVSWTGLLLFAFTLIGIFGFGLMIAGATLVFKHVAALANLLINMMIFTNGTLLSVDHFPVWLRVAANALPGTQGVTVLREAILDGRPLSAVAHHGLVGLLVNSAVYGVLGWVVFHAGSRRARGNGSLGQY